MESRIEGVRRDAFSLKPIRIIWRKVTSVSNNHLPLLPTRTQHKIFPSIVNLHNTIMDTISRLIAQNNYS